MHGAAIEFTIYICSACDNQEQVDEAKQSHYLYELELQTIVPSIDPNKMLGSGHGRWYPFPLRPRKKHTTKESFMGDDTIVYPTYYVVQTMNGCGPNQRVKYKAAYNIQMIPQEEVIKIFFSFECYSEGTRSNGHDEVNHTDGNLRSTL